MGEAVVRVLLKASAPYPRAHVVKPVSGSYVPAILQTQEAEVPGV